MVDFAVSADHWVKVEVNKMRNKYLDLTRELKKKKIEHESDGDTNYNWSDWHSHQRIDTGTGELGNERLGEAHQHCSINKISQNTEKSPGDLKRFAITQV